MAKPDESKWAGLRAHIADGTVTNAELAIHLKWGDGPIPNDVREVMGERLLHAPEPGRGRGRPRLSNMRRRMRDIELIMRQILVEEAWAEAGGKRGQLARAIEVVADQFGLSPSTLKKERARDLQGALRRTGYADYYLQRKEAARRGDERR